MLFTDKVEMNKTFSTILFLQFLILICFAFSFFGCGKKGPPVPPRQITPPTVKNLIGDIEGDSLTLTWAIPPQKELIDQKHCFQNQAARVAQCSLLVLLIYQLN